MTTATEYGERRERFIRGMALKMVLILFDRSAYRKETGIALGADSPWLSDAVNQGWIERNEEQCHLTSAGILIGSELAFEREDWYMEMAKKVGR